MTDKFIPWSTLKNPVFLKDGWSVKDACVEFKDGLFYLFFSAFYHDRGQERSHVVGVKTRDWKEFSEPFLHLDGEEGGWTGMCSPNMTKVTQETGKEKYYLTFNSWGHGHPNGKKNSLFGIESDDLKSWSEPFPIAADIQPSIPKIDVALEYENGKFYIIWKMGPIKRKGPRVKLKRMLTPKEKRLATRKAGRWTLVGTSNHPREKISLVSEEKVKFRMEDGAESVKIQENYQIIKIDGKWHLLSSDYTPKVVTLYQMEGDGTDDADWIEWFRGHDLKIPMEAFNTNHVANAPFIADWRGKDGYFYILYAGRTENKTHMGRGNNKLALARSKDLIHWKIPPN